MKPDEVEKNYLNIVSHYEACLEKYGDTHHGVDWPNQQDADKRYKVMLEIIKGVNPDGVTLLDFGCGTSHLNDYIRKHKLHSIQYSGLDISPKFIQMSESKYSTNCYYCLDILDNDSDLPRFDYVVMNGVFTEKHSLSFEEMFAYTKAVLKKVFKLAEVGVAFNVMSSIVEWEREDLFHLPFDQLAVFLTNELSRNFVIRQDYGLYEYSVYVYK